MSTLDHDRLPGDGEVPADPGATTASPAHRTTRSSTAGTGRAAGSPVPPQRQGKAQSAGPRRLAGSTPRTVGAAAAGAKAVTVSAATAKVAADGTATRRPTSCKRPAVDMAQGRGSLLTGRPASVRHRPAVCLAAALIAVLSISGASAAPVEVRTRTVSHSVSVAEQLGIETTAPAMVDEDASSHLRGLVTSRNARDAERTAAADAQAQADRRAAEEAARIAAEEARPETVHPVEGARLTSGFGARWGTLHAGVDLAAPMRTPERAAMDGVVLEAGPAAGFGLVVYIEHENGDVTVYGHMDEILVEPGQIVRAGDTIALLGNRGQSTGPHLHFEVYAGGLDGQRVDPVPWLRERGVHI